MIDLRKWDFQDNGIIRLDGLWDFRYGEFLSSHGFDSVRDRYFIKVPRAWKGYHLRSEKLPGTGYSSYRLKVLLNRGPQQLALKIPGAGCAYTLFVNDSLIARNGIPGRTKAETRPEFAPLVTLLPPGSDTISIVVRVSNFNFWKGGLWYSIGLGLAKDIKRSRERAMVLEFFLCGAFIFMMIYLFTLFLFRRQEKPALFFSIFLLLSVIRSLVTGEQFLVSLFPGIPWELIVRLDFLSFYLLLPFAVYYINSHFRKAFPKPVLLLTTLVAAAMSLLTCVTPVSFSSSLVIYMELYSLGLLVYTFVVVLRATVQRQDSAAIILTGYTLMFLAAINEVLFDNYIVNTFNSLPYGFLLLFFSQAALFSRKFSREFNQIEEMSSELKTTHDHLERINKSLVSLDESKTEFLHLISHEVRTPLNGILGFTQLLKEELQSSEFSHVIDEMNTSATRLETFSKAALLLTEMQAQSGFVKEPVWIKQLVGETISEMQDALQPKKLVIHQEGNALETEIQGDCALLKIALKCLIGNAIRYSPYEGIIAISVNLQKESLLCTVQDQGAGFPEGIPEKINLYLTYMDKQYSGTVGFDLALVKLIIDAHEGSIVTGNNPDSPGAFIRLIFYL
ncbi:MAG: sensor histidine kinase [Bacteroidetes bacterium]|nr:sensor histidine kinase [Bacteroidota bacterium]